MRFFDIPGTPGGGSIQIWTKIVSEPAVCSSACVHMCHVIKGRTILNTRSWGSPLQIYDWKPKMDGILVWIDFCFLDFDTCICIYFFPKWNPEIYFLWLGNFILLWYAFIFFLQKKEGRKKERQKKYSFMHFFFYKNSAFFAKDCWKKHLINYSKKSISLMLTPD